MKEYGVTEPVFSNASDTEIAWSAGLFEGEGCLTLSGGKPAASLNMVCFDVVERFAGLVGVGNLTIEHRHATRGWKPQMRWSTSGTQAIEVARVLLPYFGDRRRARAQEMLDWYVDTHLKECAQCGDPFIARKRNATYCGRSCSRVRDQRRQNERRRILNASKPRDKTCEDCGAVFTLAWNGGQGNTKRCTGCRAIATREGSRASKARRKVRTS